MGTRNLTVVVFGGVVRVAQYGQWDGYPSGNGVVILDFLRNKMNAKFFSGLLRTKFITNKEIEKKWVQSGVDVKSGMVSMDIAAVFKENHYHLSRDCGANVLEHIQNTSGNIELGNEFKFGGDSLFCEWAYLVDLDNNCLEVYVGFNKTSLNGVGRFAHLEKSYEEYKPIKLIKTYDLDALPQKRDFVRELEKLPKE